MDSAHHRAHNGAEDGGLSQSGLPEQVPVTSLPFDANNLPSFWLVGMPSAIWVLGLQQAWKQKPRRGSRSPDKL